MRKYNVTKTRFLGVFNGIRVYRHEQIHGIIKYTLRKGAVVLEKKVSFRDLPADLQPVVAKEWQRQRITNCA